MDGLPDKEQKPCIDPIAKVQTRNVLISWYNRRNEDIAKMKKSGQIDPEWIERYSEVLKSVEKEIERLDDTPDCVEGAEPAEKKPEEGK